MQTLGKEIGTFSAHTETMIETLSSVLQLKLVSLPARAFLSLSVKSHITCTAALSVTNWNLVPRPTYISSVAKEQTLLPESHMGSCHHNSAQPEGNPSRTIAAFAPIRRGINPWRAPRRSFISLHLPDSDPISQLEL